MSPLLLVSGLREVNTSNYCSYHKESCELLLLSLSMVLKRRNNSHSLCIDPKKTNNIKRNPTKADLMQELKDMKQLNKALEEENKRNHESIEVLRKKVASLQKQKATEFADAGSQTADSDILLCEECEFPADTLYELGEHVGEAHSGLRIPCNFCSDIYTTKESLEKHEEEVHNQTPASTTVDSLCNNYSILNKDQEEHPSINNQVTEKFKCKFCDEEFVGKYDLMMHNRKEHQDKLSICWNYQGGCKYHPNCWFSHEATENQYSQQYNCNSCDNLFISKGELSKHRKKHHPEMVSTCKNIVTGKCRYGDEKCWFIHYARNKDNHSEHEDMNNEDKSLIER